MSQSPNIAEIIVTCIVVIYALLLIIYLKKNSQSYPYRAIQPHWVVFTIASIILSQIYTTITTHCDNLQYYQLFNIIFITNVKLLCLIMRCYMLRKALSYSTYHLKRFFLDKYNVDYFRRRFFARQFKFFKVFLGIVILLSLLVFTLFGLKPLLDGLRYYLDKLYDESNDLMKQESFLIWFICNKVIAYLFFSFYAYFGITLFVFSLQKDLFNLQAEIVISFLIAFVVINLPDLIYFSIHNPKLPLYCLFIFETLFNGGVLLLHGVLIYLRYNTFKSFKIDYLMKDLTSFLNCHVTFKLFLDYIKSSKESFSTYLLFWADYKLFINKVEAYRNSQQTKVISRPLPEDSIISQGRYERNEAEENLKRKAQILFKDYFVFSHADDTYSKSTIAIDLPTDLLDKLEKNLSDISAGNCNLDLVLVYSEALQWITGKLDVLFQKYKSNKEEEERIKRIMFLIDCFEITILDDLYLTQRKISESENLSN